MFRKILLIIWIIFTIGGIGIINAYNLIALKKADGSANVVHRNTKIDVLIPDNYVIDNDFRGVWISHLVADFPSYTSVNQYKTEVNRVLETMEYFNLNAMIFHVRTHNNALYKSDLNPVASYYQSVNFNVFDPLAYIIEESQKRGIEFHAWMNPYRLTTTYTGTVEQYASLQPSYNIASRADLLLKSTHSSSPNTIILNPGEPEVRNFLTDSVLELITRYNVDAIHFDDYFYVPSVDDSLTRSKYNTNNLSIADFRREQVNLLIQQISNSIRNFNNQSGRLVQFGISPTGIYQNGSYVSPNNYRYNSNGDLTNPLGSNTAGWTHYGDYLYADSKKWVDNEWIDYIIPQSYWAFEQPVAGYADVMDWWSAVVKYKNVNLYSGMGLYMINESTPYSWSSNNEAYNQVLYGTKHAEIKGHSVYSYKHLRNAYVQSSGLFYENLSRVKNEAWNTKAILPEVRTYSPNILAGVQNLTVTKNSNGYTLNFSPVNNAKGYVIYRNTTNNLTFSPTEVINILGNTDNSIYYNDIIDNTKNYTYGVRVLSNTNSLSESSVISTDIEKYSVKFIDFNGEILKEELVEYGSSATAPTPPTRIGYTFVGWDQEFSLITTGIEVQAIHEINKYSVKFIDFNGEILKEELVEYNSSATAPSILERTGHTFVGWNQDFSNINSDIEVLAIYEINKYSVKFIDFDGQLLKEELVEYGASATAPTPPTRTGYTFVGWNQEFSLITTNIEVQAIYEINKYSVKFIDFNGEILKEELVEYGSSATAPTLPIRTGYTFVGWNQEFSLISTDIEVQAIYDITKFQITFLDEDHKTILATSFVDKGGTVEAPVVSKNGYRFIGWFFEDELFDFENTINDNLSIIAKWEPIKNGCTNPFNISNLFSLFFGLFALYLIKVKRK